MILKGIEITSDMLERFWSHVNQTDSCWLWEGYCQPSNGYGRFKLRGNTTCPAHVFAWTVTTSPVPEGLEVCHSCDTPPCVRPDHLFTGSHADNMKDCAAKGRNFNPMLNGVQHPNLKKIVCRNGHLYSQENTYLIRGERQCRICRKEAHERSYNKFRRGWVA